MHRCRWIGIAAIAGLMACSDAARITEPNTTRPQASTEESATVSSGTSEQTFEGFHVACGSELIPTTMVVRYKWHRTEHPSGSWMVKQQSLFEVRGESPTGVRMIGNGVANTTQVFSMPQGGAFTYSSNFRTHLNVQGGGQNDWLTVHAWWVLDSNGVVRVDRFVVEADCRG